MFASSASAYYPRFENEFLKAKGDAFQTFFEELMGRAHKADFMACRPWGSQGDRKNDGFLKSQRRLFQVYAPGEMSESKARAKISEDFAGALRHWGKHFDKWAFVHNAHDGLPPHVHELILETEAAHPGLTIDPWSLRELADVFHTLSDPDLFSWFGALPITRTTFEGVREILAEMGTRGPEAVQSPETASTAQQRMAYYLACCVHAFRAYEELGIDNYRYAEDKAPDIWDIFVPPACAERPVTPEEMETAQSKDPPENPARDLLPLLANQWVRRHVLLGDPGMGKSTLIQRLIAGLAEGRSTPRSEALDGALPIPFILRDLVPLLPPDISSWSWDTLCRTLHAKYKRNDQALPLCLAWSRYEDFQAELLNHPRAFFLLDGLDEIGDLTKRTAIRDAIWEGFRAEPEARWVITSRIVGYEAAEVQAAVCERKDYSVGCFGQHWLPCALGYNYRGVPIEHGLFSIQLAHLVYLCPFDNDQQRSFTQNWFRERKTADASPGLLQEVRLRGYDGIRAIARVPNLLCYMAMLKRSGKPLPDGRAVLYTEIVRAYLHGIDRAYHLSQKDHGHACPFAVKDTWHLLSVLAAEMQRLRAAGDHANRVAYDPDVDMPTGNITIPEGEVRALLVPIIQRLRPAANAPALLSEFLGHIARRSGLLLPRGTSENGMLYGFTHLSFLEYFAACYLNDQLTEADSRTVAATRRNFDAERWLREHPPGPFPVTPASFESWAADPLWAETIFFLAELRAENPDALDRLLEDLFPLLHGSRKEEPFPVIKYREQYPPWGPLDQNAVELAIRVLRNQHLNISCDTAFAWYTRLWVAYLSLDFVPHNQPWRIAPLLLGESSHASLVENALERAFSAHSKLEYLSLEDCRGLVRLNPLPGNLKLLWLAGCTALTNLGSLPSNLETVVLDFCAGITQLSRLPDGLVNLQLVGCTGLTQLDGLPGSLKLLSIRGCKGLSKETVARLRRWAETKEPRCEFRDS